MSSFNLHDKTLRDGAELIRQSRHPHTAVIASHPQYPGTRTIAPNVPQGSVTELTNFYPNIIQAQSRAPAYGQQQNLDRLDQFSHSLYEVAEHAAKDERRKRNTAASARFRQKKKQKEEAMEDRMSRVQDRNVELEERVNHLQLENNWLKELITEKNRKPASEDGEEQDERDVSSRGGTATGTSVTDDGEPGV